jgi:REP element-mobilizing transposase RayT
MARPRRDFTEGLYHVTSQASDTRFLFLSDANRRMFLDRLSATFSAFELGLVTYTLMGTHYHLVLSTPDARVSRALQRLHAWYSRRHNKTLGRGAHLFKAHPFARQIESNDDLLGVCRYVARNPVEAALVTTPLAWRWGGARANSGLEPPAIPLDEEPLRAALGGAEDWRTRYRDYLERAENASQPG